MNLEAVEAMERKFDPDLVFVESGGDNLAASFSPELVHASIYVIDVAGGDKVPRKGGPGVTRSELLVVNKTDLAPLVGADLSVMERDAGSLRGDAPTLFASVLHGEGMDLVVSWVREAVEHRRWPAATSTARPDLPPRAPARALERRDRVAACGSPSGSGETERF